jgi:hypothetical protein
MTPKKRRPDLPKTRRGYEPFEVVSAMQKAIRRSQPKDAVYWSLELWRSGYDNWAWARLNEILSEDIGPADRDLPATMKALEETSKWEKKKKNGGGLQFVHAVLLMATANKSRIVDWLLMEITSPNATRLEIPDAALDRHTRRGLRMGRDWSHFMVHGARLLDPDQAAALEGQPNMEAWLEQLDRESERHFELRMGLEPGELPPENLWAKRGPSDAESWLPPTPPADDEEAKEGEAQEQLPTESKAPGPE